MWLHLTLACNRSSLLGSNRLDFLFQLSRASNHVWFENLEGLTFAHYVSCYHILSCSIFHVLEDLIFLKCHTWERNLGHVMSCAYTPLQINIWNPKVMKLWGFFFQFSFSYFVGEFSGIPTLWNLSFCRGVFSEKKFSPASRLFFSDSVVQELRKLQSDITAATTPKTAVDSAALASAMAEVTWMYIHDVDEQSFASTSDLHGLNSAHFRSRELEARHFFFSRVSLQIQTWSEMPMCLSGSAGQSGKVSAEKARGKGGWRGPSKLLWDGQGSHGTGVPTNIHKDIDKVLFWHSLTRCACFF